MILSVENPMEFTKTTPKQKTPRTNKFSIVQWSTHTKSVVFLYTTKKQSRKEIKKTILRTIALTRTKYLGINLT